MRSVREQIMQWVMDECGRLQHSPQVVSEKTTPQEAVVTYWANFSYRARRIAEEALVLLRQKLDWIFSQLVGSSQRDSVIAAPYNPFVDQLDHPAPAVNTTRKDSGSSATGQTTQKRRPSQTEN